MPSIVTRTRNPSSPEATFAAMADLSLWPMFRGWGPLPGILRAEVVDGGPLRVGARVRVDDSDGTHHYETIVHFDPPRLLELRMELSPPGSWMLDRVEEKVQIEPDGTGSLIVRRFETFPRFLFTWPIAWMVAKVLLRRAVDRHDAAVARMLGHAHDGPAPRDSR